MEDPSGPAKFWVQKFSMMSPDYEVFADPDHKVKWLVIDKQGSFWEDQAKFVVENYVRPEGGKVGSGQCLASSSVDQISQENYEYYHFKKEKDKSWDVEGDIAGALEEGFLDSDNSDYSLDSSSGSSDDDEITIKKTKKLKQKCKWRCKTKAKFYSEREHTNQIAECKIKAKGKAKKKEKKVKKTIVNTETGKKEEKEEYEVHEDKRVKKFFYKLTIGDSDNEVPVIMEGSFNHGKSGLFWKCEGFFDAKIEGFWSPKPMVNTYSQQYPAMDLLLAFIVANVLTPEDVLRNCSPPFKSLYFD
jgi:hypothetical protein